ncbi:MAG: hypothetical protein HUK04_02115, partial [Bacteroidaceae bacterium]|nr:hypothetical protein [Bacteroidaceae bacterium]
TYGSPASLWYFEVTNIDSGYSTGIDSVGVSTTVDSAYDLQGRAVIAPRKGIYIINRKKVVLK